MLKRILSLFFILVLSQNLFADDKEDVKKQLLSKIDMVIQVVQDKSLSKDERNSKIVKVVTPTFDFVLMAKLSLGKTWKKLGKADRTKFVNLYVERMKKSYSEKLDSYTNQKVEVTKAYNPVSKKTKKPSKNKMVIETNLINGGDKMDVIYKFWKPKKQKTNKEKWLVYDVEILGVSILKADKAQFTEFLKSKSVKDLMATMADGK